MVRVVRSGAGLNEAQVAVAAGLAVERRDLALS
jgi:hypothetical protein